MSVLVVFASRYGATRGIAEHIAGVLSECGHEVRVVRATTNADLSAYDAFVIGSAAYQGSWLPDASGFVRRHTSLLVTRPVWLFSSGPLGTATTDDEGRDLRVLTEPRQFREFAETILPRGSQVFYGALNPAGLRWRDRLVRRLPDGRSLLPAGDFRDWDAIEAWARDIADELPLPDADAT